MLCAKLPDLRVRRASRAPRYCSTISVEEGYVKLVDWAGLSVESAAVSRLWCLAWFALGGHDAHAHHRAFIRAFEEALPGVAWRGFKARPLVNTPGRRLAASAERSLAEHFARQRRSRTLAVRAGIKGSWASRLCGLGVRLIIPSRTDERAPLRRGRPPPP